MKIILCIFLLYITAVSVFGQSVPLDGIVGESIDFPAAVKIEGNLMYSGVPIGEVTGGSFKRARSKFSGRLQWDSSTGLFSISELRLEDSGVFTVQNSDEPRSVSFNLTVWAVVGQSVELNGILGESVKFPAAVRNGGSLMHSGVRIGDVTSGTFTAAKFNDRLQWDNSTGLFSLSGLKMEDNGEYKVQNTDQNINTVFQLNVYKGNVPVLKPHLSVTRNEYRCTVLCSVERGTGVTLTLYREGEKKPYVTSLVESAPHLHLPQTVESGTYTCEAKNSVSRETSDPLTVGAHCTGSSAGAIAAIIIAVVAVAIVALIAVIFAVLYRRSKTEIRDEQVALQDAVKTEIQGSKTEWRDEQAALQDAVKISIQDEQAALQDAVKISIQDEQAVLLEAVKTSIQEQLQAIPPDDTGSKSKDEQAVLLEVVRRTIQEQLQAIPPDDTGSKSKVVRRIIQDEDDQILSLDGEQALIQDAVRRIILELRGRAKRNEKQKTEKGCAIS